MMEILSAFKSKEKLLQTGLCALIFIGMAIPFKVMVLIEGFTEVRPVNAVPVVAGLLFGPAGAWGCAIGNLLADMFGTFSNASILGFFGNFIAAYLPYKLWHFLGRQEKPNVKNFRNIGKFILLSAASSAATAILIACGLDVFFGMWMPQIFRIILLNNLGFPLLLGLPVLIVLTSEDGKIKMTLPAKKQGKGSRFHALAKNLFLTPFIVSETVLAVMAATGLQMSSSPVMFILGIIFILSLSGLILR